MRIVSSQTVIYSLNLPVSPTNLNDENGHPYMTLSTRVPM